MLMPARREATFIEAQTRLVCDEDLRQRLHHDRIAGRDPLVDQGREAAHEIDAALGRRGVERLGQLHGGALAMPGQQRGGGRNGHAAC